MSEDNDAERHELVLSEAPPPVVAIDTEYMYQMIGKTVSALQNTTVDGASSVVIDSVLQAHSNKKYLPDTELGMLQTQAVPMSDADLEAFKARKSLQESLQYRQEQLQIPTKTLEDITGARVRVAYRLMRYMGNVRGIGGIGIPLVMSMASTNAEISLMEIPIPYEPTVGWTRGMAAVRNLLAQVDAAGYTYTYTPSLGIYPTRGMSIAPPPLHDGYFPDDETPKWVYRGQQYTPPGYRADTDAPLATYLNICELLVRHLGIGDTDVQEQAAVAALLNPKIARLAWPCCDDIITFEEDVLLPYIGRLVLSMSQDAAIEELIKQMRVTHSEAFGMVNMYKVYAQQANVFDPALERSVLIGQYEKLAQECNEAGMVTTQLNTFKAKAQILGLTKHEEDTNVDRRAGLSSALEEAILTEKAAQIEGQIVETE